MYEYDKGPDGEDLPFSDEVTEESLDMMFPNEDDRDDYINGYN